MSSYRFTGPLTLLVPTTNNMTGTTSIASLPLDLRTMPRSCLVAYWIGSPSGTFSVQGSVDNILYADMGISIPNAASATGSAFIDLQMTAADYVKLVYTNISGTGTLTIKGSAKT